ncbi:TPA: twitching motility protein PilT, partial [Candidatus Micrarchaeota archaeon]|nr:twitching motility protein PilT [Candidatus Micrarchaeota archaeon]
MKPHMAQFRFHGCLHDFLPPSQHHETVRYPFRDAPGIKDPVEALGVPHSEVGHILVNDAPAGFSYKLQPGDRVDVHPRLPAPPLAAPRFVVDVNLGKLARWLRLLGFDTTWRNDLEDREIVDISTKESRIILTRDRRLLFHRRILDGYWIRSDQPDRQAAEILERLALWNHIHPFRRCTDCNGLIQVIAKEKIKHKLEPLTNKYYDDF